MSRHAAGSAPARISDIGRRIRVGAALGLVGGVVVAAVTATDVAASWTDKVLGGTSFSTQAFGFESSVSGGAYSMHPQSAPAVLSLTPAAPLLPGESSYAPISLRAAVGSPTVAVTVDGTTSTDSGLAEVLQYAVIRSTICGSAAFSSTASYVVGSSTGGVAMSADSATGAVVLPAGSPGIAGSVVPLCFRVTLPDTLAVWTNSAAASKSVPATWTFPGTA